MPTVLTSNPPFVIEPLSNLIVLLLALDMLVFNDLPSSLEENSTNNVADKEPIEENNPVLLDILGSSNLTVIPSYVR